MRGEAWEPVQREQAELSHDIELVAQYGRDHPGEWGNVRFVNEPVVMIEISFTADHGAHIAALRRMVEHPDRVRVLPARTSHAQRSRVMEEALAWLRDEHPGAFVGGGNGWDAVELRLAATASNVAEQLHDRYGDVVELIVGTKPFLRRIPLDAVTSPAPALRRLPDAPSEVDGVRGEIVLDGECGDRPRSALATG